MNFHRLERFFDHAATALIAFAVMYFLAHILLAWANGALEGWR